MVKKKMKTALFAAALLVLAQNAGATLFYLPPAGDSLVGTPNKRIYVKAENNETLLEVARKYDLGQNQIVKANKDVDRWMPSKPIETIAIDKEGNKYKSLGQGKDILIPNSYLLPAVARKGIVLNLPEYRMYYYRGDHVLTHPISIGRVDWNTPLGMTSIIAKTRNPTWTPPASIRREHAEQGEILPAVYPAGPDNPLGLYAMRLGRAGYLIHSTNKPLGVGMRVSHGCVRMYPEDIEKMFPMVSVGTSVHIVNQPIKVGWSGGNLYIEVHPDLEDKQRSFQQRMDVALSLIEQAKGNAYINISGAKLRQALMESNGIPVAIYSGMQAPDAAPTIVNIPATPANAQSNGYSILQPQQPPQLNDNAQDTTIINQYPGAASENVTVYPQTDDLSQETTVYEQRPEVVVPDDSTLPPPVLETIPEVPRLQEPIDYTGNQTQLPSSTQVPANSNLPPVPQLEDSVNNADYSILNNSVPAEPPRLDAPAPAPQLDNSEDYSILKNAVPMK